MGWLAMLFQNCVFIQRVDFFVRFLCFCQIGQGQQGQKRKSEKRGIWKAGFVLMEKHVCPYLSFNQTFMISPCEILLPGNGLCLKIIAVLMFFTPVLSILPSKRLLNISKERASPREFPERSGT